MDLSVVWISSKSVEEGWEEELGPSKVVDRGGGDKGSGGQP